MEWNGCGWCCGSAVASRPASGALGASPQTNTRRVGLQSGLQRRANRVAGELPVRGRRAAGIRSTPRSRSPAAPGHTEVPAARADRRDGAPRFAVPSPALGDLDGQLAVLVADEPLDGDLIAPVPPSAWAGEVRTPTARWATATAIRRAQLRPRGCSPVNHRRAPWRKNAVPRAVRAVSPPPMITTCLPAALMATARRLFHSCPPGPGVPSPVVRACPVAGGPPVVVAAAQRADRQYHRVEPAAKFVHGKVNAHLKSVTNRVPSARIWAAAG